MHHDSHIITLRLANGGPVEGRLKRASASGAEIKVPTSATVPQRLEIHDGSGGRPATVVWRRSGVIGIRFDDYFR